MEAEQQVQKRRKWLSINYFLAIVVLFQILAFVYVVNYTPAGSKPADVLILRDSTTGQEIFEVKDAIVQNYGKSVRVIGKHETYVFDSDKVVIVKNPTKETRKKFWDLLKFKGFSDE